ncbi:MAG: TIGR00159 family protein [Bacteroidales bacterium]|nr:TIGR00159 family protein [Bacteroidales bacterium]
MPLEIFGFLNMSLVDILDILLVAVIIFALVKWIKGSAAMSIFMAVMSLYIIRVIVSAMDMKMMNALMETILDMGLIALIIIFQPEIRRFLIRMGNRYVSRASRGHKIIATLLGRNTGNLDSTTVREVSEAVRNMSENLTGALIVFPHTNPLRSIAETGDMIDARVSRRLIMNLFFKNSPLHDGAVIIMDDRIVAARCTLPITEKTDIPASYGMRHKAAIGITEQSDADVVVVSEETGHISFVRNGEIKEIGNLNELKLLLKDAVSSTSESK